MHHVNALLVLLQDGRSVRHEYSDQLYVSMERCEVQGSKSFLSLAVSVDPALENILPLESLLPLYVFLVAP